MPIIIIHTTKPTFPLSKIRAHSAGEQKGSGLRRALAASAAQGGWGRKPRQIEFLQITLAENHTRHEDGGV